MTTTHCTADQIQTLIDGGLSRGDQEIVTAHLRSCSVCGSRYRLLGTFDRAMRGLPLSEARSGFTGSVMAALDLVAPPPRAFRFFTWMACQFALLIVVAMMIAVFMLTGVIQPEQLDAGNSIVGEGLRFLDGLLGSGAGIASGWLRELSPGAHPGSFVITCSAAVVLLILGVADRNFIRRQLQRSR